MLRKGEKGLGASMWAGDHPETYRLQRPTFSQRPPRQHMPVSSVTSSYTAIAPAFGYGFPAQPSSGLGSNETGGTGTGTGSSGVTPAATQILPPHQELQKFEKIAQRLKWKLYQLSEGFDRAQASLDAPLSQTHTPEMRAQAEFMFKLDFYEYYMLLERALVHLMAVFGIVISAATMKDSPHAYHHNVLTALDRPDNPLNCILGVGDARHALQKAKDLRNKWKYLTGGDISTAAQNGGLAKYQLDQMLGAIFNAFEKGYVLAQERVEAVKRMGLSQETVPWDFMVDAMDWEAI